MLLRVPSIVSAQGDMLLRVPSIALTQPWLRITGGHPIGCPRLAPPRAEPTPHHRLSTVTPVPISAKASGGKLVLRLPPKSVTVVRLEN